MALHSLKNRSSRPVFGIELDFEHERDGVAAWFDAEVRHVERVVPAPRATLIEPTAWLPLRDWLVALAVIIVVLAFWLAPRPPVPSTWSGTNAVVGQAHTVEQVPYHGPAVIYGDAAPVP